MIRALYSQSPCLNTRQRIVFHGTNATNRAVALYTRAVYYGIAHATPARRNYERNCLFVCSRTSNSVWHDGDRLPRLQRGVEDSHPLRRQCALPAGPARPDTAVCRARAKKEAACAIQRTARCSFFWQKPRSQERQSRRVNTCASPSFFISNYGMRGANVPRVRDAGRYAPGASGRRRGPRPSGMAGRQPGTDAARPRGRGMRACPRPAGRRRGGGPAAQASGRGNPSSSAARRGAAAAIPNRRQAPPPTRVRDRAAARPRIQQCFLGGARRG